MVGQRIIEVNGQSFLGVSHIEAVSALQKVGNNIHVLVCDGWNTPTPPSPEPNLVSEFNHHDAVPPHDSSTHNGQVSSGVETSTKGNDASERPSYVHDGEVRQ